MRIRYIPLVIAKETVEESDVISYAFEGDKIFVTYLGITDTFDFTGLSDGKLNVLDSEGNVLIKTQLDRNPIISAERTEGILSVELLWLIGSDADEKERFQKWIEV